MRSEVLSPSYRWGMRGRKGGSSRTWQSWVVDPRGLAPGSEFWTTMLRHHIRSHFLIPGASSQKMHVRGKVNGNNTFLSSFPTTSVHLLRLQPLARPETSTSQVFLCQESWGGALSSPGHSKSPRCVIKHGRAGCDNYKKHRERPRSRRERLAVLRERSVEAHMKSTWWALRTRQEGLPRSLEVTPHGTCLILLTSGEAGLYQWDSLGAKLEPHSRNCFLRPLTAQCHLP